ncbi:MAG: DUF6152 family protein [Gammaproteobacteria bacterium]|nr:DUF6152 family protein [Gammaproteobacteria bacterium]
MAAVIGIGAATASHIAEAHHAATMFDREQTVELVGTVREFQWTNPHIWIQVQVPNADGAVEEWSIEGGVPSRLFRSGWRPNSFEPGDAVTIRAYPMRDGGKAGLFIGAKLPDGSTLGRYD